MSEYFLNEWYVFPAGSIDKQTCNKIKKWAKGKWEESSVDTSGAITNEERKTGKKPDYKTDEKYRISDVVWCNEQWMFDLLFPFMNLANENAGWAFDIKYAESGQITRYKKGGFYNFHRDGTGCQLSKYDYPDNEFLDGHVRKLSMSVILNDNYEGGVFEFSTYQQGVHSITPVEAKAGSVIIFPSGMEHRVAPVTKGIRYSVVMWFVGPPFK